MALVQWILVILAAIGGGLGGVITGVIGNEATTGLGMLLHRRKYKIIDSWGEHLDGKEDHTYSHGMIYFEFKTGQYKYEGTNYFDTHEPRTTWSTIMSRLDTSRNFLEYTFVATKVKEPHKSFYGFGVIQFAKAAGGKLVPVSGYFYSPGIEKAVRTTHSIFSTTLPYDPKISGKAFIELAQAEGH